MTNYLIDNQKDYTLSSLTASIDGETEFEPFSDKGLGANIGTFKISMDGPNSKDRSQSYKSIGEYK